MVPYEKDRKDVEETLAAIDESASLFKEVAARTEALAKGVAEVHNAPYPEEAQSAKGPELTTGLAKLLAGLKEPPSPATLAWHTSRLRRLHAMLIAQEMAIDKERLRMVEISQKIKNSSILLTEGEDPPTAEAAAHVQALIEKAKEGLQQYASLTAKFTGVLGTLVESVSLAYLEAQAETQRTQEKRQRKQEEAQRKFEKWMKVIGAAIALIAGFFTFVNTLKSLGWV